MFVFGGSRLWGRRVSHAEDGGFLSYPASAVIVEKSERLWHRKTSPLASRVDTQSSEALKGILLSGACLE